MELKIGAAIKKHRSEKNITQEELANYLNISYQAVSKWETNTTTPDIALLPKLALFFGVTIDGLFLVNNDDHLERIDHILNHEYLTDENFDYAKRILADFLSENDNNTDVLKRFARLYLSRTNKDNLAAGRYLEKAINLSPLDEELYGLLRQVRGGINYVNRSGNDWFIKFCEPFSVKYPSNIKLKYELLDAYIEMRYFDRAHKIIENLKSIDKSGLPALFEGDIEIVKGNTEKACDIWRTAAGENQKTLYEAGERFNKIGLYDEAIKYFEASFQAAKCPRDLSSSYSLAFLYNKLGNFQKSIEMWERILDVQAADWNIVEGTQHDWPLREIAKLKAQSDHG
ncbi:MAG: helix-turn-helix domain-containing protein [Saccharofermentanales bacterium]